jgi:hypothetical protein
MKSALLLLAALSTGAAAQNLYKCSADGKVTYSQAPCERGTSSVVAVPEAPPPDPDAKARLQQQQRDLKQLEQARQQREAKQDRDEKVADREARARFKKCAKLRLEHKHAAEDARNAAIQKAESAQLKARRAADKLALECGQ